MGGGGVIGVSNRVGELVCFTEVTGSPAIEYASAIVIWCVVVERTQLSFRQMLTALVRPRSTRPPREAPPLGPEWDAASDHGGLREVLHSAQRQEIRILGTVYAIPKGEETPIWMVDTRTSSPRVLTHSIRLEPQRADRASKRPHASGLTRQLVKLLHDPTVSAFLAETDLSN